MSLHLACGCQGLGDLRTGGGAGVGGDLHGPCLAGGRLGRALARSGWRSGLVLSPWVPGWALPCGGGWVALGLAVPISCPPKLDRGPGVWRGLWSWPPGPLGPLPRRVGCLPPVPPASSPGPLLSWRIPGSVAGCLCSVLCRGAGCMALGALSVCIWPLEAVGLHLHDHSA